MKLVFMRVYKSTYNKYRYMESVEDVPTMMYEAMSIGKRKAKSDYETNNYMLYTVNDTQRNNRLFRSDDYGFLK